MPLLFHLVVLLGLIAVNAVYVSAEFSTVSTRRSRVRLLVEEGNRLARLLLPVLESATALDHAIAASQVGITVSSLVLGAYAQATVGAELAPLVAARAGLDELTALSVTSLGVLLALTLTQVVFGELVPKFLALQYPTRVALLMIIPLSWTGKLLGWFIRLLNGSASAMLRLFGFSVAGHRHIHSPEEIELLIAESRDGGVLEPDEHRRLARALKLSKRVARELMVPRLRVSAIDADTTIDEALDYIVASPYTRLPVYHGSVDNIIGLLHAKDLVQAQLSGQTTGSVSTVLRPLLNVSADLTADQLLKLLRERRCHQAVVRDANGALAGFVTLEDVLSEMFGRVGDEFKD
jgi:CBS domain containing-hemolysin-like protein